MQTNRFVQIDRSAGGLRLTVREGDGRTAPTIATLVRHVWVNSIVWQIQTEEFLAQHGCVPETSVHAWEEHKYLGRVSDLIEGRINQDAHHG